MDELKLVIEKLDAIGQQNEGMSGKIDKLLQWKAALEQRCLGHVEKTNDLRGEIFGKDGRDGLKVRVQRLWNCKGDLRDKAAKWQDFGMYVLKAVVVFLILAAITYVYKKL